jgi:DNA-binding NarL/FixJ family response regulator
MSIPAKILVVDNRQFLRLSLCSLLADESDWDVYEAESGKVALDRVQEVEPDVVVLAVLMTEMNGLEAASKIRKLSPETRVIFMSSHYTPQEATVITRLFGGDFVQESDLGRELIPTISRLLPQASQTALESDWIRDG